MNLMDELLKKYNLKYEDLSKEERETLNTWVSSLQQGGLTVEKVKEYIRAMRSQVDQELATYQLGSTQDIFLKARLRNYMLLEAFLETPERAKAQLEKALEGMR